MGPPRGWEMSPTRRPGQPLIDGTRLGEKRSRNEIRAGLPQLRLRDSRITCQASPLIGRAFAAGEAALGVEADRARLQVGRLQRTRPNSLFGRHDAGAAGFGQRGQGPAGRACPSPGRRPGGCRREATSAQNRPGIQAAEAVPGSRLNHAEPSSVASRRLILSVNHQRSTKRRACRWPPRGTSARRVQ